MEIKLEIKLSKKLEKLLKHCLLIIFKIFFSECKSNVFNVGTYVYFFLYWNKKIFLGLDEILVLKLRIVMIFLIIHYFFVNVNSLVKFRLKFLKFIFNFKQNGYEVAAFTSHVSFVLFVVFSKCKKDIIFLY